MLCQCLKYLPTSVLFPGILTTLDYATKYPCLLARCPANNAKEENVKLIEISFVSWFSSLLGQVW